MGVKAAGTPGAAAAAGLGPRSPAAGGGARHRGGAGDRGDLRSLSDLPLAAGAERGRTAVRCPGQAAVCRGHQARPVVQGVQGLLFEHVPSARPTLGPLLTGV